MLTILAVVLAVVLLVGLVELMIRAMGGCFLSSLFLWLNAGEVVGLIGTLIGAAFGRDD